MIRSFFEELLLYSGLFGLYYIIMQAIIEKWGFFSDVGHLGLTVTLLVQAVLLARYGRKSMPRLLLSFLVPLVYSLIELREGVANLLNTAHIGFWIYALLSAVLLIAHEKTRDIGRRIADVLLVFLNIFIFLFLYFYFDTWKSINTQIDGNQLTIGTILSYLSEFLSDLTHWYIIFGGLLLAATIAIGRNDIARLKDRIFSLFGRYVDSGVRDAIIEKGAYEATKRNLCILFSDIMSFTTLCENNSANDIADMLNIYFQFWNEIVKKYNGIIDKYIGDAIMVIFGFDDEGAACSMAAACALEAAQSSELLYARLAEKNLPVPAGFGVGCHYGELIIGDIGSDDRKNFTVIGDTVNTASRIESVSRKTESRVIISSQVYKRLDDATKENFKALGQIKLKGKNSAVSILGNG